MAAAKAAPWSRETIGKAEDEDNEATRVRVCREPTTT
jgi:hypothetical protein